MKHSKVLQLGQQLVLGSLPVFWCVGHTLQGQVVIQQLIGHPTFTVDSLLACCANIANVAVDPLLLQISNRKVQVGWTLGKSWNNICYSLHKVVLRRQLYGPLLVFAIASISIM